VTLAPEVHPEKMVSPLKEKRVFPEHLESRVDLGSLDFQDPKEILVCQECRASQA
jgi:hypothetical protein